MTTVTRDTLDAAVEFDGPFTLTPNGENSASLQSWTGGLRAPEVHDEGDGGVSVDRPDWEPVDGHSGQYGYSGPIMHPSETLSGGMAARIIAEGGTYAVVEVRDEDGDPAGWALMRYTGSAK